MNDVTIILVQFAHLFRRQYITNLYLKASQAIKITIWYVLVLFIWKMSNIKTGVKFLCIRKSVGKPLKFNSQVMSLYDQQLQFDSNELCQWTDNMNVWFTLLILGPWFRISQNKLLGLFVLVMMIVWLDGIYFWGKQGVRRIGW